jgi:hypothetical protein
MDHPSRPCFDRLAPVSDRYAVLPVAEAFTWSACEPEVGPGEWYLVAFRSTRRAGVDEALLTSYDDWAHAEAMSAPGYAHYFKGPTMADGRCMSFCLWDSRAEARAAAGRPAHRRAVGQTHQAYDEYVLEFHRVTRRAEGGFAFEPYDAPIEPGMPVEDAVRAPLTPRLAAS